MQTSPLASAVPRTPPASAQKAAVIAHELNNVLATITGYGTFVRDELSGGNPAAFNVRQMLEDAQVIVDAARRGAELTARLMTVDAVSDTFVEAPTS